MRQAVRHPSSVGWLAALVAFIAITVGARMSGPDIAAANTLLSDAAAAPLFGAAVLCLTRGRWMRRSDISLAGLGLLVLAMMRCLLGDFRTLVPGRVDIPLLTVAVAGAGNLIAILLFGLAGSGILLRRELPHRRLLAALAAILATACLAAGIIGVSVGAPDLGKLGFLFLTIGISAGWMIVTTMHLRATRPGLGWLPSVLLLTTAVSASHAPADLWPASWMLVPGAIAVLAAIAAIIGAVHVMIDTLDEQHDEQARLSRDLLAADQATDRRTVHDQENLHEVRSVLAGLRTAASSLSIYEDRIDATVRRKLQNSVTAELARLQQLVDPPAAAPIEEVFLLDVISPVIVAEFVQGLRISLDCENVGVMVRPVDFASIVSNLLDNVRIHANGAGASLRTFIGGSLVTLEVRDDGPGLPPHEIDAVFDRGRRGTRSLQHAIAGSGLGLYTARRLAREMGGDLVLSLPPEGGTSFVLTVPAASGARTQTFGHRPRMKVLPGLNRPVLVEPDWTRDLSWLPTTKLGQPIASL